jgi:hypothetical protein
MHTMARNEYDTITEVCAYLDGQISQDNLEARIVNRWAGFDVWPSFVIDVMRLVTMNLSGAELHCRLRQVLDSADVGLTLVA